MNEIGILLNNIKFLALSHFHNDHIGNAKLFRNATLILQEEECEELFGLHQVLSFVDSLNAKSGVIDHLNPEQIDHP